MGQYWHPVNLDKHEWIDPHKLGSGLKAWEQVANDRGTGTALLILCATLPGMGRGGGDLDVENNWHGPERDMKVHNVTPGPVPEDYPTVARRTIGRWAGDRIALVGDYAEHSDLSPKHDAGSIYGRCVNARSREMYPNDVAEAAKRGPLYEDITADVCAVIEHELHGRFVGDGWRQFIDDEWPVTLSLTRKQALDLAATLGKSHEISGSIERQLESVPLPPCRPDVTIGQ